MQSANHLGSLFDLERMNTMKTVIALFVTLTFAIASQTAMAQNAGQSNGGDFLAGIFGQQVETNQGQPNGGQNSKNNQTDPNRNLRLGIHEGDEGSDDSADAGTSDDDSSSL